MGIEKSRSNIKKSNWEQYCGTHGAELKSRSGAKCLEPGVEVKQ